MNKINPIEFCNWLQGALDMTNAKEFNEDQTQMVKDKLNSVFEHAIDPQRDSETTVDRDELQEIHDGKNTAPPNTNRKQNAGGRRGEVRYMC